MKKKNLYRLMSLAMVLVMLFAIAACTNGGEGTATTAGTTVQGKTTAQKTTAQKTTAQKTTKATTVAVTTAKPFEPQTPVSETPGITEGLKAEVDKAIAGTFTADKWDGSAVNTDWYSASESAFEIDTAAKLAGFLKLVADGNDFNKKSVKITANIDLNGKDLAATTAIFRGSLNGDNHVIANYKLVISAGASGLFGKLEGSATVENIGFVNCTYEGNGKNTVGFLAGHANPEFGVGITLSNVYYSATGNSESVSGKNIGLIGNIGAMGYLVINNCEVAGSIYTGKGSAGQAVGGYIGMVTQGATICISNSINNAEINAGRFGSGFIGAVGSSAAANISIVGCVNNGKISSPGKSHGGFIGYAISMAIDTANIENCTNNGEIEAAGNVGGIIGQCDVGEVTVKNCTNTGSLSITGESGLGSIVGSSSADCKLTIEGCSNTGTADLPENGTPAA